MTAALILILAAGCPQDPDPEEDDDSWDVITVLFDGVFGYPFRDFKLRFDDYPYAHGKRYFLGRRAGDGEKPHDKKIAFETGTYFGRVDHDVSFWGVRGTVRAPSGCDVSLDLAQYREEFDGETSRLTFHQYHLNVGGKGWDTGRSYQFSAGLGIGFLDGEGGLTDAGFSIRSALVLYPQEPFSLRFSASITFFEHATLNDFRGEAGIHAGRFALTAGVKSLISSEEGDDLTGPTLGLMVFF